MTISPYKESLLWEGDTDVESGWLMRLDIGANEFQSFISDGLFKPTGATTPRKYRLDLVGFLFSRRQAFIVLPKIFSGVDDASVIRDVIACIRVYRNRVKRGLRALEASESLTIHSDAARLVDLFLGLLDWTLERGFHSEDLESRTDELTDVNWGATMDIGLPLHFGNTVVYSEIIGRRTQYELGPLAPLQAKAILDLHSRLSPVSSFWIQDYDPIIEQARTINADQYGMEGQSVSDLNELVDFLNICNRDHDRELATLLFDWLSGRLRDSARPAAFGSSAFHFVWQDMCNAATCMFGDAISHNEIASQPLYVLRGVPRPAEGQKPDVLRAQGSQVRILDAKWYDVQSGDVPGTQDVIKQIMYQASVSNTWSVIQNAFLVPLPHDADSVVDLGEVRMAVNGVTDTRFEPVAIVGLPWKKAVSIYCGLTKRPFDDEAQANQY